MYFPPLHHKGNQVLMESMKVMTKVHVEEAETLVLCLSVLSKEDSVERWRGGKPP